MQDPPPTAIFVVAGIAAATLIVGLLSPFIEQTLGPIFGSP